MADEDEEEMLRSVALQNAQTILLARQRAEREIIQAKEALEQKTEELAQAKELFQNVFDQAAVGIARVDINGRCLMVNPRLCEMLGYTSEELLAIGLSQLLPDDLTADFEVAPRLVSGEIPVYRRRKTLLAQERRGDVGLSHRICRTRKAKRSKQVLHRRHSGHHRPQAS